MKRIFLAIALIFSSLCPVLAQDRTPADTDNPRTANSQKYFETKVNEIDEMLTGKKTDLAQKAYQELVGIMQRNISQNQRKFMEARGEEKARLKPLFDQQNQLYTETKTMSADMIKNHKQIVGKLQAFGRTL
jgi:hypothetical protein